MQQEDLQYSGELSRKLLHLLAAAYPLGYLWLGPKNGIFVLTAISVIALGLDFSRWRFEPVHVFFDRWFGFMMRRSEKNTTSKWPAINGATWTTVSFTVLVFLFPVDVAIVSFVLFMIGDAAAALVGRKWGRHPWARNGCTIEGSLSFLISSLLAAFLLSSQLSPVGAFELTLPAIVIACIVASLIEAAPLRVNDNLVAPLGAALSMVAVSAVF